MPGFKVRQSPPLGRSRESPFVYVEIRTDLERSICMQKLAGSEAFFELLVELTAGEVLWCPASCMVPIPFSSIIFCGHMGVGGPLHRLTDRVLVLVGPSKASDPPSLMPLKHTTYHQMRFSESEKPKEIPELASLPNNPYL